MSSYGIPEELTYESLSRLYPSVKSEYRKNPFNGATFASGDIQMKINKMPRSFLNPATLCLNFRVKHTISAGTTQVAAGGTESVILLGNALSYFSQQVVKPVSGQWQDTISYPGLISNTIMNMTTSPTEQIAMLSLGYNSTNFGSGFTNAGDVVTNTATIAIAGSEIIYRSYSVPIIGILNTHKLIPLFCDEIEIDFTVNTAKNFLVTIVTNTTTNTFQLEDIEIVGDVLTLEESGFNELLKMYPNGMSIKSESYLYGTSSIAAGNNVKGSFDITYSHGLNSLKKFIWWASPNDQWEQNYGGVNPNLQNYQLFIGATAYPQLPVKSYSLSEQFYQNQKSFGAFVSTAHCGSCNRNCMAKCSLPAAGSKYTAEFTAFTYAKPNLAGTLLSTNSNKYYCSLDLELINQLKNTLYSGISTKGSSNLLRIIVAENLAAYVHTVTFYSVYDAVITFDWANGQIFAST